MAMPDNKNSCRKSLDGLIGARTREIHRQTGSRFQHQLIGSLTKRP